MNEGRTDYVGFVSISDDSSDRVGAITRTSKSTSAPEDIINANPLRFSSEFYDSELGLIYYNYRHYSPLDGRFLSRDPIEEQGGFNLYAFVRNNGINSTDLLGLKDSWTIQGTARNIVKKLIKMEFDITDGLSAGSLLNHGTATWIIKGEITCTCQKREKILIAEKKEEKKVRMALPIHLKRISGSMPSGAITLPALIGTLLSEAILSLFERNLLLYWVPSESKAAMVNFLNKMKAKPTIKSDFWTDDLCNK